MAHEALQGWPRASQTLLPLMLIGTGQAVPFAQIILLPNFLVADSLTSFQTVFNSH